MIKKLVVIGVASFVGYKAIKKLLNADQFIFEPIPSIEESQQGYERNDLSDIFDEQALLDGQRLDELNADAMGHDHIDTFTAHHDNHLDDQALFEMNRLS